jgi:hypothetical protein
MYGREVVVLNLAKLEEAAIAELSVSVVLSFLQETADIRVEMRGLEGGCLSGVERVYGVTYLRQHLGASSTSKSIVMSPSDVSRSTDMASVLCTTAPSRLLSPAPAL